MQTKEDIVKNWLPRYTGTPLEEFKPYILLTNFSNTIINFGMGSAMAATVMDLLTAINPKAVLFLGKCGGLKKVSALGDFILPIAAIRGEGTSDDYARPEIPALPSFRLQRAVSEMIIKHEMDYWTGTVYTTNRRVWEHDGKFKDYLKEIRALGIDMETATIFIVGFVNSIPHGALLLVSDNPMQPDGVKTEESDKKVTSNFVEKHLQIGIESLDELANSGESVKHMRFES
jgi:AMP nucleosidase